MKTVSTLVDTYEERAYCDICEKEYIFTGSKLMSNPPQYGHKCKCDNIYLRHAYPLIRYETSPGVSQE